MSQIVITCDNDDMYQIIKSDIESGKIELGKCNKNYLIDKFGYFYFEDRGENINESGFLETIKAKAILTSSKLKIERVKS